MCQNNLRTFSVDYYREFTLLFHRIIFTNKKKTNKVHAFEKKYTKRAMFFMIKNKGVYSLNETKQTQT
jgi:hypothetical protein